MKYASLILLISTLAHLQLFSQSVLGNDRELWEALSGTYEDYRYSEISNRRFKHEDIIRRVSQLDASFNVATVGASNGGRSLKLVSIGDGPINILLWSQMHGNEPTATMALMDILNWLSAPHSKFESQKNELLSKVTLHLLPMLNPDGAARFRRRNEQDIDINRDARRLQTPEGRTLKRVRDSLDADWGFNLHDQGRRTSVGQMPATLSFLAPAFDFDRSVNEKRGDAMQLIAHMNQHLQLEIPNQVGRYWDEFEPRAFGDNIQKWGTRTILIESGGQYGDREKQLIRKLNFLVLQLAFSSIANNEFENFSLDQYDEIPNNSRGMQDVILKNIQLPMTMGGYLTDIAITLEEVDNIGYDDHYLSARIVDVGDLSTSSAYIVHNMEGYTVKSALQEKETIMSMDELKRKQAELLRRGVAYVEVGEPDYFQSSILLQINKQPISELTLGANPSLLFFKNGELRFSLINGYLMDIRKSISDLIEEKKKM
ncbi:MAG: M14 family zinc carboxypeptidase [Cyclobacteriaceae bacterium]